MIIISCETAENNLRSRILEIVIEDTSLVNPNEPIENSESPEEFIAHKMDCVLKLLKIGYRLVSSPAFDSSTGFYEWWLEKLDK